MASQHCSTHRGGRPDASPPLVKNERLTGVNQPLHQCGSTTVSQPEDQDASTSTTRRLSPGFRNKPWCACQQEPVEEPKSLCKRFLKFLFGHLGLFILVSLIAALGAIAFIKMEEGEEQRRLILKKNRALDIIDADNYISKYLWHYQTQENLTFREWDRKVKTNLKLLETYVIDGVNTYQYDGTIEGWNTDWTFSKALLFTISIMTTIGYGHIYPRTLSGQLFTIIYGLVGTPLLLVFLAKIGDGMSHVFKCTYSRICCRWCRATRYRSEAPRGKRVKRLSEDVVGKEEYMPTDEVHVPMIINSILIMLFLMLGGIIFSRWEAWSVTSACYFSFVTVSTIGFGDMVPGNSFGTDGSLAAFRMGMTIVYCIFGLALVSMCIQMMQDQILAKVRWTAQELGIIESPTTRRVVQYKKSRGQVPQTADAENGRGSSAAKAERRRQRRRERRLEKEKAREESKRAQREEDEVQKKGNGAKGETSAVAPLEDDASRLLDDGLEEDLFDLA